MLQYRRRIAYLYAYGYGERRCTGFVKMEERADTCRLKIHLDEWHDSEESAGTVHIYFYNRKRMIGIPLGELAGNGGALEWQGTIDPENILGKGVALADTRGIWIRCSSNRGYAAEWDDAPVDISRFMLYPEGGLKCISCPKFGSCERSGQGAADRRRKVYERSDPAGA